ncbi:branched-chain amino acid ABC transporter permease [Pseudonocardia ailaonensis]|uniref:Branched-chain amino acid ABC transporter permease n=1 Tax=Pseudonocardia ailaonensis TaxID=367279 RepID=A0ABN2N6C1_9PSEU
MLTLQALINGLAMGVTYALIGIPVVLIYRSSKIINFAIGGMMVWAGLIGNVLPGLLPLPIAYILLLVICVAASIGFSLLVARFVIGASDVIGVLVTLGVGFALSGLAVVFFGPDPRTIERVVPFASFTLVDGRLSLSSDVVVALAILLVVAAAVAVVLTRTQYGRRVRAISDDPVTARSLGIRIGPVMVATYVILGVCIFAATIAVVPSQGISGDSGLTLLIGTMTGVTIGGPERIEGAVVGGLIVGMIGSLGTTLFSPFYQALALAVLLILILMVRPAGLFTGLRGRAVA